MAITDLIAQAGQNPNDPIPRFMQGQQLQQQQQLQQLQGQQAQQQIGLQRQQGERAQQEFEIKLVAPILQKIEELPDDLQKQKAFEQAKQFLGQQGVDISDTPDTYLDFTASGAKDAILSVSGLKPEPLFTKPATKDFTQESRKIFALTKDQADLVPIPKAGDITNITLPGSDKLFDAIGKKAGEQIVANKVLATKAADSINNANNAIKLLDSGVITGFGAEFITNLGRAVTQLGFDTGDAIANTQAFAANQGKAVLDILGSGALGAGTGISDNDRLFAKQIAGGTITLEEDSIRRIVALNAKVSQNVINRHNKEFKQIKDKSPIDLSVEMPEFIESTKKTQTVLDEADAILGL